MKSSFVRTAAIASISAVLLTSPVAAGAIYNSLPSTLPPNVTSEAYQATQTSEFGELIAFGGSDRTLTTVTILMSDWALASTYGSVSPTWNQELTLNLYNVDNSGSTPQPGTVLASRTQTFAIPWRPEADPSCGTAWRGSDGNCYNGLAFTVAFDFTGITVPEQLIFGLALNTQSWGASPTGVSGPYNSLNVGLVTTGASTGSDPLPGTAYWNTKNAAYYSDGGAGGVGTFREDGDWSPYTVGASFDVATPEPGTCLLLSLGLIGFGLIARRRGQAV